MPQGEIGRTAKKLSQVMSAIRVAHFQRQRSPIDPTSPVIYWEETCFGGAPFDVPLVILRTSPCRWFKAGGCVMCNYELMAIDEGVTPSQIEAQVDNAISRLGGLDQYHYVFLTSQGSFFDDHEVDQLTRLSIARKLRAAGIRSMSTESEAKYCLTKIDAICQFRDELKVPLSIGIGLEASNEVIRNAIINKGLSNKTFEAACAGLRGAGVGYYTYVTVGKPVLTIEEDIQDAVDAVQYSLDQGAFMVVLEMVNIQPHTLTSWLYDRKRYEPPSLWTGIEILRRLPYQVAKRVSLKGVDADIEPTPVALSTSCPKCEVQLKELIREWNYRRNPSAVTSMLTLCDCRDQWRERAAARTPEGLELRARRFIEAMSVSVVVRSSGHTDEH